MTYHGTNSYIIDTPDGRFILDPGPAEDSAHFEAIVENLNKRARLYLPRDTQLAALSNRNMKAICDRLNGTPRKCLGWRTPTEAFREEIMKLR
ncbi:hypothetical protein C0U40_17850 [Amylibacter cionae]|nr:hypothetical protein C0U40_17850 [Amylibacter cionae]